MSKIKDLDAAVKGIDDLAPVDNLEMAHLAWTVERDTIIGKLEMLIADTPYKAYKDTLRETIDFIKRGEV